MTRAFMGFYKVTPASRLENLCAEWHFTTIEARPLVRPAVYVAQEHPMLDIVMLALARRLLPGGHRLRLRLRTTVTE